MRTTFIVITSAFFMFSEISAQIEKLPMESIQKVSVEALEAFKMLVTDNNFANMGFKSKNEVKTAKLGDPIREFTVRLDMLKKYKPGDDPNNLLTGGNRVIYPVTVDNQVRSSIEITEVEKKWSATGFGGSNFIKLLDKTRKTQVDSSKLSPSSYFAVRIPAFNLYFIAHYAENKLMLTPVFDTSGLGLKAQITKSADEVFEALIPAAQKHDGSPR